MESDLWSGPPRLRTRVLLTFISFDVILDWNVNPLGAIFSPTFLQKITFLSLRSFFFCCCRRLFQKEKKKGIRSSRKKSSLANPIQFPTSLISFFFLLRLLLLLVVMTVLHTGAGKKLSKALFSIKPNEKTIKIDFPSMLQFFPFILMARDCKTYFLSD